MDTEQLKLIVEMISGLGGDAREAFIVYVVAWAAVVIVKALLWSACWFGCFWMVIHMIRYLIKNVCASDRLALAASVSLVKDCWPNEELERICQFLRENCEKK